LSSMLLPPILRFKIMSTIMNDMSFANMTRPNNVNNSLQ
jgi:hypothetical protein